MFLRHPSNPLISPRDVKPSRPVFEIIGTFNTGSRPSTVKPCC
ncbi:MAG: hypothetical protein U0703_10610 [Anaerolineae bacterium]